MSYCRFAEGDVYAYECDGGVQFYIADGRRELDRLCRTHERAYQYAKELRDTHGLDVPSHAIEALKADAIEEAARIYGPGSAVAELSAENAKLREERDMYRDLVGCMVHPDIPDQLQAENTELRELVRDMWLFVHMACKKYPRLFDPPAQGAQAVRLNAIDAFEQRMRELGMEVEG